MKSIILFFLLTDLYAFEQINYNQNQNVPELKQTKELEDGHKVHEMGGLSKFHRITKNEKAIELLMKEVQSLKKQVQDLKKQISSQPKQGTR